MRRNSVRKVTYTFAEADLSANAWHMVKMNGLSKAGRITRIVTWAAVGATTSANTQVWVINGEYTADPATPSTVPDHDVALKRTGITLTGHATNASDDYNVQNGVDGATFSAIPEEEGVYLALFIPTGATVKETKVTVYAEECN